jgi:hypothetical protein
LPALCVVLVALTIFFAALEPQYRRTFWAFDTKQAMCRRQWTAWPEGPHKDEDIASYMDGGEFLRYVGEPVVPWIKRHVCGPAPEPPKWLTVEWREGVLKHAHLLPGDGAARLAAALGTSMLQTHDVATQDSSPSATQAHIASAAASPLPFLPVPPPTKASESDLEV